MTKNIQTNTAHPSSRFLQSLGELSADGTGLGNADGQPNDAMQIIYGLAEMLAAEHNVAMESDQTWQFDLLRGHVRNCLDYALALGDKYAGNAYAADVSQRVYVPPKWIVLAARWADQATPREKDDPLLESLLPPLIAFVLDGSEQRTDRRREWQGVSHAALLIAFHLGRLGKLGQLNGWLAARRLSAITPSDEN